MATLDPDLPDGWDDRPTAWTLLAADDDDLLARSMAAPPRALTPPTLHVEDVVYGDGVAWADIVPPLWASPEDQWGDLDAEHQCWLADDYLASAFPDESAERQHWDEDVADGYFQSFFAGEDESALAPSDLDDAVVLARSLSPSLGTMVDASARSETPA